MAQPQAKAPIDLTDLLRRAAAHHQRGELSEAEALYREVLDRQPKNFDALHLYGVLMHQRGKPVEALGLIGKALKANARAPAAHSNHGIVLAVLNRHAEAVSAYERAIALKPDYPEAHNNRGNALRALKRTDDALLAYERALTLKPDYAEAHNNRGNALMELGRPEDALPSYDRALACRSNYADAFINRGQCLNALKRSDEALSDFDKALAQNPRHPTALKERGRLLYERGELAAALACYDGCLAVTSDDAETHARRGLALRDLKRFDEAFAAYDRALALKPDFIDAVVARGNVFYQMGRFGEALAEYERATAMQPDFAYGLNNRGNALVELNRHDEALKDYDAAVAGTPFASALVNRGSALRYLGHIDEAMASFDRAIVLEPNMPEAHWNRALLCLTLGDYDRGFEGYEWRWRGATELVPRGFAQPQWRGEDISGKTIFLHAEQGFGDSIQMLRYLPLVKAKAARIVLELPDLLMPLLGPMAEGVIVLNRGTPLPPFDVHCPLMSLPLAFGTRVETIPANIPYLRTPVERLETWRARLPRTDKPRVGLVWSGKPSHKNDHNRSIPLAKLAPLIAMPGVSFVSLQREYRDTDLPTLAHLNLERIDEALNDFADTAAALEQCDLVIAVDTAVAHLAGGLGRPLWVLLSHIQDWRWLRDRADSPWYPSARLFRQPRDGNWDPVIAALSRELGAFKR